MKLSKRMLAVLCTLLMLASCFALPYGAMAAEEADAPTSEYGTVVGVVQQDEVKTTVNGGDFIGRQFNNLSPTIPLTKAGGNYAIVLEIKVQQDYGFTNGDWMQASLGDGNIAIFPSEGSSFNPGHLITKWLPQEGRANDTWMPVMISLNGYNYSDIKSVQFNIYNHPERYDNKLTSDDRLYGASISFRNVYVVDMSRTAAGGPNKNVVSFGRPEQVFTQNSADGNHTPSNVNINGVLYNLATADMDLSKLTLEFDIKYTSTNPDFDASKIVNGRIRMGGGETKGTWSNGKTPMKDTWYHIAVPLTEFNNLTDASAINSIYAFNYNDAASGTNPGFTTHAKNIVITHNDVVALENALEEAKTFVYDADENAAAYETALNNARAFFTSTTATYADAATALAALNTAKANVTNGRDLVYEVARYTAHEYTQNTTLYANADQIYYDWRSWDGYTNTGVDLRDDLNGDITKIGGNRYFQTTVTFTPNPNWTGTPLETLDILKRLEVRVRTNDGSEKRTNSYTLQTINKTVTADKVVYEMELLLDDSQRFEAEWDDIRQSIIFPYISVNSDANKATPVICTLSNVRIVNKTAEAIEADLKEAAEGYITPGKYTAESTAEYLTYKEQAQAMLENDGATLQEKTQLIAKIDAAKAKFVSVVPEYVQFGEPEAITTWTNSGIEGSHAQSQRFTVTSNKITGNETFANLQLRFEVKVTRGDGALDVTNTFVNGNTTLEGIDTGAGNPQKSFGNNAGSFLGNASADEWISVYINLSDYNNGIADADLSKLTSVNLFAYNDLRGATSDPSITVQVKNVAIVDNTNVSAVEDLKNLFTDVTKDGTVDFTTDSYAAYKAVYDEWYEKAYATVDLSQYEAAKAALEEAYKGLVCVDKTVMTFGDNFNKGWDSNGSGFYADWRDANQGLVDTSIRNHDNLVIRFDISVAAKEGYTLPETLTTTAMRLAIRKQGGEEQSIEFQNKVAIPNLDPTKVNSIEVPFTAKTGSSNTDGLLKSIILWMNFSELSGADGKYVFTISNARVEDATKEKMTAALKADAETTLDAMEEANGCVYDDATTGDFKAAQAAALEILAKEDPTYAELADAQAAIDAGKAKLVAVGHIVASLDYMNTYSEADDFICVDKKAPATYDLSQYNFNNLVIRLNLRLGDLNGGITPTQGAGTVTVNSHNIMLRSVAPDGTRGQISLSGRQLKWGDTYTEIPLKNMIQDSWGFDGAGAIDMRYINQIFVMGYVKENNSKPPQKYRMTVDNACIVDTTAEKNLGAVKTVGNGRMNIAGGMLYGADDTLTASTSSETSKFVGWKKNDSFVKANGEDDTLNLPVNGKQDVTAYFTKEDEAVVVYTGKYNRVVDVQVVKDAAALVAPDAPAITGQTFVGWDEIGQLTMGEANIVKAIYTTDEVTEANGYTVDLTSTSNDNATSGKFYGFDDRTTVTAAAAPAGQKFSHWKVNGNIAGYTDTLTFYVSGNMTIEAVYVAEDVVVEQELSASITQNQMVANGSAYNFEVIAQTYLPEGYDLMAYGVIFAPKAETLTELATTGATEGATLDVVSSSNIPNRQYKITLEKVTAGRTRSAMAYITARNADGEIVTVYSGVETKVAQ